jgi:hypothetical protein
MSSSTARAVDYSSIRRTIYVYGLERESREHSRRNRRDAARYIDDGLRVTDDYGFNLNIETRADGSRRVVRGWNPISEYNERERLRTITRAEGTDQAGRPSGLPERELTDYEAGGFEEIQSIWETMIDIFLVGRRHSKDCGIPNCDHPVHFGGSETGMLKARAKVNVTALLNM